MRSESIVLSLVLVGCAAPRVHEPHDAAIEGPSDDAVVSATSPATVLLHVRTETVTTEAFHRFDPDCETTYLSEIAFRALLAKQADAHAEAWAWFDEAGDVQTLLAKARRKRARAVVFVERDLHRDVRLVNNKALCGIKGGGRIAVVAVDSGARIFFADVSAQIEHYKGESHAFANLAGQALDAAVAGRPVKRETPAINQQRVRANKKKSPRWQHERLAPGSVESPCKVIRQQSQHAIFERLTCYSGAYAVTGDGRTVGGQINGPITAFLWSDDKVTTFGPGRVRAIANDGKTAVGLLDGAPDLDKPGAAPGLWRRGRHGQPLEQLVGQGRAITPNGKYAAGFAWGYGRGIAGLRWDLGARGRRVELGSIGVPGSGQNIQAVAISDDGQIVVGTERIPGGFQAFLWQGGSMRRLMGLNDAPQVSASACNASCSVIGGISQGPSGFHEAIRWVNGQPSLLFSMPSGARSSNVWALDKRGNLAAGEVFFVPDKGSMTTRAYRWDAQRGFAFVDDLAAQAGIELKDWRFWSVTAMSADGRVLVGRGMAGSSKQWNAYRLVLH